MGNLLFNLLSCGKFAFGCGKFALQPPEQWEICFWPWEICFSTSSVVGKLLWIIGNLLFNSYLEDSFAEGDYGYGDASDGAPHAVRNIGTHSSLEYDENGSIIERAGAMGTRSYFYGSDARLRFVDDAESNTINSKN